MCSGDERPDRFREALEAVGVVGLAAERLDHAYRNQALLWEDGETPSQRALRTETVEI
jgi:hypothetical protein